MQEQCSYTRCPNFAFLECICTMPPTLICKDHEESHRQLDGDHEIRDYMPILAQANSVDIKETNEDKVKYALGSYGGNLGLLKLKAFIAKLHPEIEQCLKIMNEKFIKDIMKLVKSNEKKLKEKTEKYLIAFKKVLVNMKISSEEFFKQIFMIFCDFHAAVDSELSDELHRTVGKLKGLCKMPGKVKKYYVIETTIDDADNKFYLKVMTLEEYDKEKIISVFKDEYDNFIIDDSAIIREFTQLDLEFTKSKSNIKAQFLEEFHKYIHSLADNEKFTQISIYYSPLPTKLDTLYLDVFPEWVVAYSGIFMKSHFDIKQTLDISGKLFIVLVDLIMDLSFILVFSDMISYISLVLETSEVIIATGSLDDSIIIVQNTPKKTTEYYLDSTYVLRYVKDISLGIDSFAIVSSSSYIQDTNSLVFSIKEGNCYSYNLNEESLQMPFINTLSEPALQVLYINTIKLLVIRTASRLLFFTANYQLLRITTCNLLYLDHFIHEKNIFISWLEAKKAIYSQILLRDDEISKLFLSSKGKRLSIAKTVKYVKSRSYGIYNRIETHYNKYEKTIKKINFFEIAKNPLIIENPFDSNFANEDDTVRDNLTDLKVQKRKIKSLQNKPENLVCDNLCDLCDEYCMIAEEHNFHLCGRAHNCQEPCGISGNCCAQGKKQCEYQINPWKTTHEEYHKCLEQEHYCPIMCPGCGVFCCLKTKHEGFHEAMHLKIYFNESCGETCGTVQHTHKVYCLGGEECPRNVFEDYIQHEDNFDYWNDCNKFWRYFGWNLGSEESYNN
ncbi:hypothetical protein SteCoe_10535 [Stentor coeruleus]|uniref:Uncharacterized protein n=1 Tax=Stentor coeruleus TaxID=5963 RepID=A0A1R2CFA1_9CILI|nr:hypothetical protein SteCoe_10535 [Stentor coeruleus]